MKLPITTLLACAESTTSAFQVNSFSGSQPFICNNLSVSLSTLPDLNSRFFPKLAKVEVPCIDMVGFNSSSLLNILVSPYLV
jgi:hypothetical protein